MAGFSGRGQGVPLRRGHHQI